MAHLIYIKDSVLTLWLNVKLSLEVNYNLEVSAIDIEAKVPSRIQRYFITSQPIDSTRRIHNPNTGKYRVAHYPLTDLINKAWVLILFYVNGQTE